MIIDVIDLELDSLYFDRKYDTARYSRAKLIHRNEDVVITKVDKIADRTYNVNAIVMGNYDDYDVELTIKNNMINQYSCTCEDYIKGNLCKHIIATSIEVVEPSNASTDEGRRRLQKQREAEEERQRELFRIKREQEAKRREYEQKYLKGLQTIEQFKRDQYGLIKTNQLDIKELYENVLASSYKKEAELATNIKLEYTASIMDDRCLRINFKIGQTRMYRLKNLHEIYQAYKNGTELYYGKQLRFIPKKENFAPESQEMFEYIIRHAKIIEYARELDRYGNSHYETNNMYIKGEEIDDFFAVNKGKNLIIEWHSDEAEEYQFTNEKLDIGCVIDKEDVTIHIGQYWSLDGKTTKTSEEYVLKLNIEEYSRIYSKDKIFVFYQNKIYKMNKDKNLLKLLDLFGHTDKILIPEDRLEEFQQYVLPQLGMVKTENLPEEWAKEGIIVDNLASKILLDADDNGNILMELKFCYKDYEFNILEKEYKQYVKENNIVRNIPEETEVVKRIFKDGFEPINGRKEFVMKNTDAIYEFLSTKINGYMNDFEVLATEKFKNKQIKQPKISSVGIRVDNGLLELDMSKINIDLDEIKNILKDYSIKKKYHKLKNGDFLNLAASDDLNLLEEIATTLDVDYSKMENGVVKLPVNRSVYLEKVFNTRKDIQVAKNEGFTDIINNIENLGASDNTKIDDEFEKVLRDYQKNGYRWLKTLETYKFGGILADDMGLGKTLQIIALLKNEIESNEKTTSIVVCPSTLVLNWKAEVEKWCDKIKVLIVKGNVEERAQLLENYKDYNLVITSYDLLKRDVEKYEDKQFKYIIADEAQYIKNSSTQNATALKSLVGEIRFALTGTPIENSIAELWSIFDFIMPGYLYNYNKFKKKFEEPILKYEDAEALVRLKKLISPFVLRRIKEDVLQELPEKNITVMKNEMEKEQEKIYLSYLANTKKEIADELSESSFEKSKFKILMLLTRLRQICCHPSLFIENYKGESGKLKQCLDLLNEAIAAGHKVLLFSSYTSMFDIIEKELEKNNIKYFKLVGNTPVGSRIEMVDNFNNDDSVKVFLISLKAGGTGLNLTSADVVIHYDPWWNVSSENQATDRAYRIGQKNSVQVYKLITSNSIEEKINQMQERKAKLSKEVLSTEETFINKLSKEEILDLFE